MPAPTPSADSVGERPLASFLPLIPLIPEGRKRKFLPLIPEGQKRKKEESGAAPRHGEDDAVRSSGTTPGIGMRDRERVRVRVIGIRARV
jgi:hypothetical protein